MTRGQPFWYDFYTICAELHREGENGNPPVLFLAPNDDL